MSGNAYTHEFMQKVPPTPLRLHIENLHEMAYLAGIYGDALAMFEHHLMAVAVFTAEPSGYVPPQTGPVTSFDPTAVQEAIKTASFQMGAAIRKMRDNLAQSQTPERKYQRMIASERRAAKAHLRSEVTRVRRELGLPTK